MSELVAPVAASRYQMYRVEGDGSGGMEWSGWSLTVNLRSNSYPIDCQVEGGDANDAFLLIFFSLTSWKCLTPEQDLNLKVPNNFIKCVLTF